MKPIDPDKLYLPWMLKFYWKAVLIFLTISCAALAIGVGLDLPVYRYAEAHRDELLQMKRRDWYWMLRVMGYLPVWICAVVAIVLHDTRYLRKYSLGVCCGRGLLLLICTAVSGIFAEVIKVVVRRERPPASIEQLDASPIYSWHLYSFRPFADTATRAWYENGGLGFPSSHAIVAFAAAFTFMRLFPRTSIVWLLLAVGCAMTRIFMLGHYVSDTVGSAIVAYAVVWFFWKWHLYNQRDLIRTGGGVPPLFEKCD